MTFGEQLRHTPHLVQFFLVGVGSLFGFSVTAFVLKVFHLRAVERVKTANDIKTACYEARLSLEQYVNAKLMEDANRASQAVRKKSFRLN